ncbi:GTP-binding protein [Brachybacterium sp. AOP25-B2-12]|uniref:GTP-binding protein n=1 Tax=Brachybacterium sp. AOP25-B2-12 TaxID=3457710 RepID=UPI004034BA6E
MTRPRTAANRAADAGTGRPSLDHGRRARHHLGTAARHRVVFAGPVGVGKTTAVRVLTDVDAVDTEVPISAPASSEDRAVPGKLTTTVGIDYGIWKPTEDLSVALVGTPGQDRFGTARASLLAPHSRVVLWAFGDGDQLVDDVRSWLDTVASPVVHRRMAIAVTRTDDGANAARAALAPLLAEHNVPTAPVLAVDPRDRDAVMRVVCAALDLPEGAR